MTASINEVVSFTMIKNEEDVVENFVRHTLTYVDKMFFLLNYSTDRTLKILKELDNEFEGKIFLKQDNSNSFDQGDKTTKEYREIIKKFQPDVFLLLDTDEFLNGSSEYLKREIDTTKSVFKIKRYDYVYDKDPEDYFNPIKEMTERKSDELTPKSIIISKNSVSPSLKIGDGNHNVRLKGKVVNDGTLSEIYISHFPIRSIQQFQNKNVQGWTNYVKDHLVRSFSDDTPAKHWRNAFNWLAQQNFNIDSFVLKKYLYKDRSIVTVDDPVYVDQSKYTDFSSEDYRNNELSSTLYSVLREVESVLNEREEANKSSISELIKNGTTQMITTNGMVPYGPDTIPHISLDGRTVFITGAVKNISKINQTVARLPLEIAPNRNLQFTAPGSNGTIISWQVSSDGTLKIIGATNPISKDSWLPFNFSFII